MVNRVLTWSECQFQTNQKKAWALLSWREFETISYLPPLPRKAGSSFPHGIPATYFGDWAVFSLNLIEFSLLEGAYCDGFLAKSSVLPLLRLTCCGDARDSFTAFSLGTQGAHSSLHYPVVLERTVRPLSCCWGPWMDSGFWWNGGLLLQ